MSSTRAPSKLVKNSRGRHVFEKLAEEEVDHLHRLEARYRALLERDPRARIAADVPVLQGRRQRAVRRGHRAAAQAGRRRGRGAAHRHPLRARLAQVLQALRRAVRGLRGQADLPGVRRGGARAPRAADSRVSGARSPGATPCSARAAPPRRGRRRPARRDRPRDRSAPAHDRVRRPVQPDGPRAASGRGRRARVRGDRPRHRRRAWPRRRRRRRVHGLTFVPGIEVTAVWAGRDVHVLGYWVTARRRSSRFLDAQRRRRVARVAAIGARPGRAGAADRRRSAPRPAGQRPGASMGRPTWPALLVVAGHAASVQDAFDRLLGDGQPAYVPAQRGRRSRRVRDHPRRRRARLAGASRREPAATIDLAAWATRRPRRARGLPLGPRRDQEELPRARRATRPARHRWLRLPRRRRDEQAIRRPGRLVASACPRPLGGPARPTPRRRRPA